MPSPLTDTLERLQEAFRTIMRTMGTQLAEPVSGLTGPQFYILHQLEQKEKCTVGELAESMGVKPSAITAMVDRLDKHGFVARDRDEEDRRVVYISLRDSGKKILQVAKQNRREKLTKMFSHLSEDELQHFVLLFEKLAMAAVIETNSEN